MDLADIAIEAAANADAVPAFVAAGFDLVPQPVWVLDLARISHIYANAAGFAFWGARDLDDLQTQILTPLAPGVVARLCGVVRDGIEGKAASLRWTFYPRGRATNLDVVMRPVWIEPGRLGILTIGHAALPAGGPPRGAEALHHTAMPTTSYDLDGLVLFRNPAAEEMFASAEHRFLDRFVDRESGAAFWNAILEVGVASDVFEVVTDQGVVWHAIDGTRVTDPISNAHNVIVCERDVSDLKATETRLRERERQLRQVQDIARLGDWRFDIGSGHCELSPTIAEIHGLDEATISFERLCELVHPADLAPMLDNIRRAIESGETTEWVHRLILRNGEVRHLWHRCAPEHGHDGVVIAARMVARDVTEEARARERIERLALWDGVTGLANRVAFGEALKGTMRRTSATGGTLLVLDLDSFKEINDTRGHAAGDSVLKEVGARLARAVGQGGSAARIGGDKFALVVPGLTNADFARMLARELQEAIAAPIDLDEGRVRMGVSIGIARWPQDGTRSEDVLRHANLATEAVKLDGGAGHRQFAPSMREEADERSWVIEQLPAAIERGEIEVHYQPIVALATRAHVGFEALVRWRSPSRGLLMPDRFIPILEQAGLIGELGAEVLRIAARQARAWLDSGIDPGRIAINLGGGQVRDDGALQKVLETIREAGLRPDRLELEVTETVTIGRHTREISNLLSAFRANGMAIVLDDFGTGHASLTHLTRLPVDRIKIDRSFVSGITEKSADAAIVRAIVALATNLGMEVVAEGVETEAQAGFLRGCGCSYAQGYLFGRPQPAEACVGLVH
ncbi:putative bifunctional diguanylate cyclase/phosphodiesterase [Segnochrobactrum spirostomi]|uniref:EAL domain-containing protein n=1 Tax=Segnochrobactrum spirostomi TaxID=2608987 RepID=A0A6A7XY67_9HYPH|nr:GGDEF and EAL domain-containing protein [Segnochrobactrum spirostomi]MQT11395.1 EAL domain-containing protein [Segnochrobactrum spirostomi]